MNKRVSIPLRLHDLIWTDDQFYREVETNKKMSISKFPRCDQWCNDEGLHLAFALAGYGPEDISVKVKNNSIRISNVNKIEDSNNIQQGIIVRGIARRNFNVGFVVADDFNLNRSKAFIKNGLLEILIPRKLESEEIDIEVRSE